MDNMDQFVDFNNMQDNEPVQQENMGMNLNFDNNETDHFSEQMNMMSQPMSMGGMGMNMQNGFQTNQMGNNPENLTQEEMQLIAQVEQEKETRQMALRDKTLNENKLKAEKQAQAKQELATWKNGQQQLKARRQAQNMDKAQDVKQQVEEAKKSKNVWIRVTENCEMDAKEYTGEKDVSRMRECMISRKADLAKK